MVAGFPCSSVPCYSLTTACRSLGKCLPHPMSSAMQPAPAHWDHSTQTWGCSTQILPLDGSRGAPDMPEVIHSLLGTFFFPWSFPAWFASGVSFSFHCLLAGPCSVRWQMGQNSLCLGPSTPRGSARWQQHPRKMQADSSVPLLPDISRRAVPNVS